MKRLAPIIFTLLFLCPAAHAFPVAGEDYLITYTLDSDLDNINNPLSTISFIQYGGAFLNASGYTPGMDRVYGTADDIFWDMDPAGSYCGCGELFETELVSASSDILSCIPDDRSLTFGAMFYDSGGLYSFCSPILECLGDYTLYFTQEGSWAANPYNNWIYPSTFTTPYYITAYESERYYATTPVPEPTTILLLGTGILGIVGPVRRKIRN